MASLNLWYVAAIVLGAAAAFCGYYGAVLDGQKNSDEQSSRIEAQLKNLAGEIQQARIAKPSDERREKISELQNRYNQIAEEFFRTLPLKAAEHQSQKATEVVEELRRTAELRVIFEKVLIESRALAGAFNQSAGREIIKVESTEFPENIFHQTKGYLTYILFKFDSGTAWAFRMIFQDASPAFQLVRIDPHTVHKPYAEQNLTNDSINLVVLPEMVFISLNAHISSEVRSNIVGERAGAKIAKDGFPDEVIGLIRRMVEFAIVTTASKNRDGR